MISNCLVFTSRVSRLAGHLHHLKSDLGLREATMTLHGAFKAGVAAALLQGFAALACAPVAAQDKESPPTPFIVQEHTIRKLSEHVWEIPDRNRPGVPNVAIVVGTRATLIVDTGMGPKSGAVIAREAQQLSKNTEFYLATTDFRPEHITGAAALPPNTKWLIPAAQKVDIAASTQTYMNNFMARSAELKNALQDVKLRDPDVIFDRDVKIDLGGGVIVHLIWYGPARTNGDVVVFVEPDRLLHGGNILSSMSYPGMPESTPSVKNWLDILDRLEALHPLIILPNHGDVRDASLIPSQRTVLRDLQRRSLELKAEGATAEAAGGTLTAEFDAKYPDWKNLGAIPAIVRRFYEETSP
jgi:glyoxylase-like metal-dependent hydrolase (beta-lactamase superfamily II)